MGRAKIVCTIGPASRSPEVLRGLVRAGMDVARLNFSFGQADVHREAYQDIRRIARDEGRCVAVLQDLQGPKVRLRLAAPTLNLVSGDTLLLTSAEEPEAVNEASVSSPELIDALKPADRLILADGTLELVVDACHDGAVRCTSLRSGVVRNGMGITAPEAAMNLPGLTDKDREDLAFGLELGVDLVALSFVRTAQDLIDLRRLMERHGQVLPIVAKIELAQALEHFDGILSEAWGVMVARGDLGVQLPLEEVPFHQKSIIRRCNAAGVPVITATQMLESMVRESRPTRAEASDVANAVLDGTDAVMLSAETAIGRYPVEAVTTTRRIVEVADRHFPHDTWLHRWKTSDPEDPTAAVALAATELAISVRAKAIVCNTTSGHTAREVARFRPPMTILGMTPEPATLNRLALVWGVEPMLSPDCQSTDAMLQICIGLALQAGYARSGDTLVITAGVPLGVPGTTNLIKVATAP